MTYPEWVFHVGTAIIWLAAVSAWSFVGYYGHQTRFEETDVGRHMLATMVMFAVVLTYTGVRSLGSEPTTIRAIPMAAIWFRILIFASVCYVILGWLFLLVKVQRQARRDDVH